MNEDDDLSWKMNDIRAELGADFINNLTEDFLSVLNADTACDPKDFSYGLQDRVREKIAEIRNKNYEPIYLEMSLAFNEVVQEHLLKMLKAYETTHQINDLQSQLSDAVISIQEGMIIYSEGRERRNGKRGGEEKKQKNARAKMQQEAKEPMRELWFAWYKSSDEIRTKIYGDKTQEKFLDAMKLEFVDDQNKPLFSRNTIISRLIPAWKLTLPVEL